MTRAGKILVVDDQPQNVKLLADLLTVKGYHVVTAASGGEALNQIARESPDLILLDVLMPGIDGYEVCRKVRENPETALLPVIIVTTLDQREERVKGIEAGADDFITKPISTAELLARVRSLIRIRELHQMVRAQSVEVSAANVQLERALSELRATQAELIQAEKMAALGKLVGGVAHEINTPLGAMTSNTDLLERGFRKLKGTTDAAGQALLDTLESLLRVNSQACRRISGIVKNLKTFARLDEAEWKSADLCEGMESTLSLVHHLHKGRIEIVRDYHDIPPVTCYPGQINQVFMNLLVNAIQAIDGTGTIWVRIMQDEQYVTIGIQDTGCGIVEENLPKIFDPGFSTKGVGGGMGLGLSICYQIVSGHHGTIRASSEPGKGSTFTVRLPIRPPTR